MSDDPCPECAGDGCIDRVDGSQVTCDVCNGSGDRPFEMATLDICKAAWQSARTFGEMTTLTAEWLDGLLPYSFSYGGAPDEDNGLIANGILADLNRSGFLTEGSQPGHGWLPGWDGAGYRQRAHVDLLVPEDHVAGLVWRLMQHERDGLWVKVSRPSWRRRRGDRNVCRISEAGEYTPEGAVPSCWAGYALPKTHWWHLAALHRNRAMGEILSSCFQVSAVDLTWGRNDLLWDTLAPLTEREDA